MKSGKSKARNEESYLAKDLSVEDVARLSGCGVATVYRVKREL
jgi:hypothetical protein